ncbi:hypothetical protein HS1genome_0964 [Sulfodiicoccus acidiphilus]|uniref:ArsR family transcriptional regulator n=1 Tax=Sulfodiicoccus acidiphilus TaxID=1670455 RepID=A0A348B323_9CREN|nr:hypothetical protein [Sulfodiicoccus acidiphilus]BBD72575.1 hypothetical protein HS1genome_0964 [Sulfodiicoccus acidiphilus]GGT93573.1 hypothetical protein GCM10007116_09110 [Sulfodiicoccus acidiphilus]
MSLSVRLKLLMVLSEVGEVNITRLLRLTGLRYDVLERNLKYLEEKRYVEVTRLGRSRIVRLNFSNPQVIVIRDLLEELSEL